MLDSRRISAHEPDKRTLWAVVYRLLDKLHRDTGMVGFAQNDAKMNRVTTQPVDAQHNQHIEFMAPHSLTDAGKDWPLP